MALIKEPLDVDFFVEPQPLSATEKVAISDFIKSYKKKNRVNKKEKVSIEEYAVA
jgi:hypothetical protein